MIDGLSDTTEQNVYNGCVYWCMFTAVSAVRSLQCLDPMGWVILNILVLFLIMIFMFDVKLLQLWESPEV